MKKLIVCFAIFVLLIGCNSTTSEIEENNYVGFGEVSPQNNVVNEKSVVNEKNVVNETIKENDLGKEEAMNTQNEKASVIDLLGIPEEQTYMWESDAGLSDMPDKDSIKKIALYWYQEPIEDMPFYSLYECIDFSENEIMYQSLQTPGSKIVKYDLSEEDKDRYLNAIDYELIERQAAGNGRWNVSIESENGDCYVCNLAYDFWDSSNPKAELLKLLFDKVEMTNYDISLAGF